MGRGISGSFLVGKKKMRFLPFFLQPRRSVAVLGPSVRPRLSGADTTLAASRHRHSQWQSPRRGITWAMFLMRRSLSAPLLLVLSVALAADAPHLSHDQLAKAVRSDSISIPTPGELFAALEKPGKPNWSGQYRGPIPMTYRNRAQIALNLGGLIADGFIAVEAKDRQQVKNIGSDIIKLAKALGV